MSLILVILLVLIIAGGLPPIGINTQYGYGPSAVGLVLLLVLLLVLFGGIGFPASHWRY